MCGKLRVSSGTHRGNNLEARTIRREGRSRKRSEPSETLRRSPPPAVKIKSDPHGDMRRSREIVTRLNPSCIRSREVTEVSVITCRLIEDLHEDPTRALLYPRRV